MAGWGEYMGHEAAGEVLETVGPASVQPGQRVVAMPQTTCGDCFYCNSGDYIHCLAGAGFSSPAGSATLAQHMLKQDLLLLPIPDDISTEHGGHGLLRSWAELRWNGTH